MLEVLGKAEAAAARVDGEGNAVEENRAVRQPSIYGNMKMYLHASHISCLSLVADHGCEIYTRVFCLEIVLDNLLAHLCTARDRAKVAAAHRSML